MDNLNSIDFKTNLPISKGKVAIIICLCGSIYIKLAQFLTLISHLKVINFEAVLKIIKQS